MTGPGGLSKLVRLLRLDGIRTTLLVFAVLATLIPSWSTTYLSYSQNKRSLQGKITGELQSMSAATAREIDLWLKERLYDLRVFASSYEVSENLDRASRVRGQALGRLRDYLGSVRDRFTDYEAFMVVDRDGHVVATTGQTGGASLPASLLSEVRGGNPGVGEPVWDETVHQVVVTVAVPIRGAAGRTIGALAARLNLHSVDDILKRFATASTADLYLTTENGALITSARTGSKEPMRAHLPPETVQSLQQHAAGTVAYTGLQQVPVVGALRGIPSLNWAVIAEIPRREAFQQISRLRNETALIVGTLMVGVGLLAYLLSLLIVRPLNRLARAAARVAANDLDVALPVPGGGEIGYLTTVFNNMVSRLRETREELERLSLTDGLTKLYNRRYLMERLADEINRARRHKRVLTVIMADVDRFKHYNDTHGHVAGDHALVRVASVLRDSIREIDCASRYGGEEFVVILTETPIEGGSEVCERVRQRLAAERLEGGKITISMGIAEFPAHGDSAESMIASADAAMYDAKRGGGDRVGRAARGGKRAPSRTA